jgi:hypothetical protein
MVRKVIGSKLFARRKAVMDKEFSQAGKPVSREPDWRWCPNSERGSSAGILAGCPEGVLALDLAGVTPAGQPPGRRRYRRKRLELRTPVD